MKLTTAGESHGKALVAIIEGLPAHLKISIEKINAELALRQSGYGRGGRQKIERDRAEILTGVRNGETLGSPLTLCIYNKDFQNWETCMSSEACDESVMQAKSLTKVRPGHADLAGVLKFGQMDARNILERASARETAIRVAAGGVYKQYLSALGVEIAGYVKEICGVKDQGRSETSLIPKATQAAPRPNAGRSIALLRFSPFGQPPALIQPPASPSRLIPLRSPALPSPPALGSISPANKKKMNQPQQNKENESAPKQQAQIKNESAPK